MLDWHSESSNTRTSRPLRPSSPTWIRSSHSHTLSNPAPHSISTSSTPSAPSTPATLSSPTLVLADTDFEKTFQDIIEHWRVNALTTTDKHYLSSTQIRVKEYECVTDVFRLRHGVELQDERICFMEYPTRVHEYMSRYFDYATQTSYGLTLKNLGSSSMRPSHSLIIVDIIYNPSGSVKQPDSSFMPPNLPTPDRANGLRYQDGTFQHFPSLVFEVVVSNEDRERLLDDADKKTFSIHTSISCWIGLKIELQSNKFWMGWGRRRLAGYGMKLEEQTEDDQGVAAYFPIYPHPQIPLLEEFTIPSTLIFNPLPVPPTCPAEFVLAIESVRAAIEEGIDLM